VDGYCAYYNDNEEKYETELSGNMKIVDEIFSRAPLAEIDTALAAAKEKCDAVVKDYKDNLNKKNLLDKEIVNLENTKTDLGNGIINLTELKNAKSIAFFDVDDYSPKIMNEKEEKAFKLYLTVVDHGKKPSKMFYYQLYCDNWSSSMKVDGDYGLLIDKSDEEIIKITQSRIDKMISKGLSVYNLLKIDDKYLSDAMLKKKVDIKINDRSERINKLNKEIADMVFEKETLEQTIEKE
jgi:hypothetical protein